MRTVICLRVAGFFGVLSALMSQAEFISGKGYTIGPLTFSRGNARSLVMAVPCPDQSHSCSPDVKWEYKLSMNETWKTVTSFGRHRQLQAIYFLKELLPDKLHYIRALVSPPGTYTPIKEVWTCPNLPPPVSLLRVANAGPGWLDVRWKRPTEKCKSALIFLVRYNVDGLPLGPSKTFGVLDAHGGYASTHPLHPCPKDSSQFCVLFTDHVQPGRNHTVEVRTKRYDIDANSVGEPQRITVLADARVLESEDDVHGVRGNLREDTMHATETLRSGIVIPFWILASVGSILFITLLNTLICVSKSFRNNNSESSNNMYSQISIGEIPPILSVSVSNIYDYPQLPQRKENSPLF